MHARPLLFALALAGVARALVAQGGAALPSVAASPKSPVQSATPSIAKATKPNATSPAPIPLGPDGMRIGTDLAKVGDSILQRTTWTPAGQVRFVAASRGKRLLLDMGRVDLDVRKDTARARAYRRVIPAHAAIPVGTPFILHGKFGDLATRITGYDVWASRVVATLEVPARVDSLAKKDDKLTAVAERVGLAHAAPLAPVAPAVSPTLAPATTTTAQAIGSEPCVRDSLPADVTAREKWVRDSLEDVVKNTPRPAHTGFSRKVITRASRATGCFGLGRLALAMLLRDDRGEWFVERVVILDDKGKVIALRVSDLRFRAHEILGAYDIDGDGIDELATRATTERAGAVTILKLDVKGRKLERIAAGFAWEDL